MKVLLPVLLALLTVTVVSATGHAAMRASNSFRPEMSAQLDNTVALGAYVAGVTATNSAPLSAFGVLVGKMPVYGLAFQGWSSPRNGFDAGLFESYRLLGSQLVLTWQPGGTEGIQQPAVSWRSLAQGASLLPGTNETLDTYITKWAQNAKNYGHPVLVRLMHEMNGSWYPWGYGVNGNTNPADFVAAWRHVVDIFRSVGATNVQFIWCVAAAASSSADASLFPGDAYVDWLSIDGYNRVPQEWTSLFDRFAVPYRILTALSNKPIMIGETASIEQTISGGQSKADWIRQGFLTSIPQSFPQIKAILWFNHAGQTGEDYPVDSSASSLDAYRQVVTNSYYQGTAIASSPPTPTSTSMPAPIVTATRQPSATPEPSTGNRPTPTVRFQLDAVRVQNSARPNWGKHAKSVPRIRTGHRVVLAIYVTIEQLPRKVSLKLVWVAKRGAHVVTTHRAQISFSSGRGRRYSAHWVHDFRTIGAYSVTGTATIEGQTKLKAVKFKVTR
jgi:Glycosyl hydrolase family 26